MIRAFFIKNLSGFLKVKLGHATLSFCGVICECVCVCVTGRGDRNPSRDKLYLESLLNNTFPSLIVFSGKIVCVWGGG